MTLSAIKDAWLVMIQLLIQRMVFFSFFKSSRTNKMHTCMQARRVLEF